MIAGNVRFSCPYVIGNEEISFEMSRFNALK